MTNRTTWVEPAPAAPTHLWDAINHRPACDRAKALEPAAVDPLRVTCADCRRHPIMQPARACTWAVAVATGVR